MKQIKKKGFVGDLFAFAELLLYSLFPFFLTASAGVLPPIFYAGASNVVAGIFILSGLLLFHRSSLLFRREALVPAMIGSGLVLLVFFPLVFLAGQNMSPGNIAILLQAEVLFSFLFFGVSGLETISLKRLLGAFLVILGATVILSKGFTWEINVWSFVLLAATALAPMANYYQRKAALLVSPLGYTGYRCLIGGILLVLASLLFESPIQNMSLSYETLFLIVANGILIFGISKWFWLECISRIGVTKSLSYNAATPAFTLVFAYLIFQEIPTAPQIFGLATVIIGVPLILSPIKHQPFSGKTVSGDQIGRKFGFPTLNITLDSGIFKPAGVFAVHVELHGKTYSGVLHAGPRPTLNKEEYRTEVHLFDFDEEIVVGEKIYGEMVKKIRDVRSFDNTEDLKKQIEKDVRKAKRIV